MRHPPHKLRGTTLALQAILKGLYHTAPYSLFLSARTTCSATA